MTTRTAVGAGGAWTTAATWSPSGTPLAGDDCKLDATSGNVTIDTGAVARSLDCTGYTGTLTLGSGVTFVLGDATAGAGNVALKLVAGMTFTIAGGGFFNFASTSATQQTITTAGKTFSNVTILGAGSSYVLGDGLTVAAGNTFTLSAGTFSTGGFAMSIGFMVISGATAKTFSAGSSAIAVTGNSAASVNVSGTGITFTANTAVMTFSGAQSGLAGGAWNGMSVVFTSAVTSSGRITSAPTGLNNVTFNGPAAKTGVFIVANGNPTITGTWTMTGPSAINRISMQSDVVGTARTVTVGTGFSFTNVDFQDITAAGAAGTWTGTSMGNALGNSNITFDTPATQTHTASAGGNWSDITKWTSRVPLPQDNVVVDAGTTGTLTADMPRLGADVTFTGFAGTAAFNSVANTIYGSLVLGSGMTVSGNQNLFLSARSAKTITSAGKAIGQPTIIAAVGGTYTLTDAFDNSTGAVLLTLSNGTLDTAGFALTTGALSLTGTATRAITFGTSTVTLTRTTAAAVLDATVVTGLTLSGASATFVVSATSANARTFMGGGQTYGTLTYTVAGSTGSLTITGANTFATINFSDASNARSLLFTAATTTTITTNWNVFGTAGKLMTVASATAATHTLSKVSGIVSRDFLSITNSIATGGATWYAGANSVDGGGNTGWNFTAPPVNNPTNFFFMFEGAMV